MTENPVHTGQVLGRPLAFYRPQRGGPDFPWIDFMQMLRCLGMPRHERLAVAAKCKGGPFKDDFVEVPGAVRPLLLAPHYVAQGMIEGMIEAAGVNAQARLDYMLAGGQAVEQITAGLDGEALSRFIKAAIDRNDGKRASGGLS